MSTLTYPQIAECILKLSDFFIENPGKATPWEKEWAQVAYENYFHPLNKARLTKVLKEAQKKNFFSDIRFVFDYGSGLGAATLACLELFSAMKLEHVLVEQSLIAKKIAQENFNALKNKSWLQNLDENHISQPERTAVVFSYSLTELEKLPKWFFEVEALILIEPSTHQEGRKLLELRKQLIKNNYFIWAPCTHQEDCPLLLHSKSDWCHDRVEYKADSYFLEIEKHLPMKNSTLTMSYLLARKKSPSNNISKQDFQWARITGDLLKEKGKDRQLVCRGPEREFLTWMHKYFLKDQKPEEFLRGDLIQLSTLIEKKSNELRVLPNDGKTTQIMKGDIS